MDNLVVVGKGAGDNTNYNLTDDQYKAADGLIGFIGDDFDPKKYIGGLTGPGGTGKTYTMNFIINKCKYSDSVIKKAAPTHKACRVLSDSLGGRSVETIQSTFGFKLDMRLQDFNPNRPQFNPMSKAKLEGIKVLIIDEASMIPAKLVTYICNKCKELEIKVIFTGDPFQLAPPGESRSIAFDRCHVLYHLTQIVRQGADNPVTELLVMLRNDIKNKTYKFLEYIGRSTNKDNYNNKGEGFAVMNPRSFQQTIDKSFHNEDYTKNIDMYRIVGYTNHCVSSWNGYIRNSIIKDADKNIVTKNDLIMSYQTIVNEFMEVTINNSEEYIIHDIVDFKDQDYLFKGFLVRFQLVHGGTITTPLFIVDHRDRFSIQQYHKIMQSLIGKGERSTSGTRVANWKEYYVFKKKYLLAANVIDREGKVLYNRDIDYGFSITSHKSQGSTYNSVFVDVNNIVFDKHGHPYANQDDLLRRLYVACSRNKKELILSYGR